ncbi:MAG: hypothetical protein WDW36_007663 [Sanguina aurantia]
MLAIHGKKTEAVDLKTPLISYVRNTYSDREADDAADDLNMVQQLRAEMANMVAHPSSREIFCRYLRCLTAIETRFPISKEKGHAQLAFTWSDAFRPRNKLSQTNIHYEKAAVLFNLGAILSQQALACDRQSTEGLTLACKGFQEAAGVFQHLRESESNKMDSPGSVDVGAECAAMLERLMLAQAQECVYHRACLGATLPQTLARIAKQTHAMYADAERSFSSPLLKDHFDKGWASHVQLKGSVFDIESLTQSAKFLHTEQRVNVEIAVLQEAFKRLQSTKKFASAVSADALASVAAIQESVQFALTKAEKDNSTVYLMRVPLFAEAPAISGALLVKASRPAGLDSGEPLFTGLVPDGCAKALSKYTDAVDSLIRAQLDKLAGATDAARIKLRECELPDTLEALEARSLTALPEAARRDIEDIEAIGGLAHLKGILSEIGELGRNVEEELSKSAGSLEVDARLDNEMRTLFNEKWRCQPSATMAKPYWDTIASYSGETGAGKSLLVDALMLLAGARADSGMVRAGSDRADLVAEFSLDALPEARDWLQREELDEDGQCQLRRVLRTEGNSKAWINGRPANARQLGELASLLVEIHGQHEHQALLSRSHQMALLDAYAGHDALLSTTPGRDLTLCVHARAPMVATGPEDPAMVVANLRRLMGGLQGSASERAGMEEAMKEMKKGDNVLPKLMASAPQMYDALFASELQKYNPLVADVDKNVKAQTDLLGALEQENRLFRSIFDVDGWHAACVGSAAGLRESAKSFRGLLDHISEGLRFYIGMADVVGRARQECNDFAFTRQVQRDELRQELERQASHEEAERLTRQMAGTALFHPPSPTPPTQQPPPYYQPQQPQQPPYSSPPGPQPHYGYSVPVPPPPGQQQQQQQQQYPPQQQYGAPPNPYQAYSQQAPPPPPPPPPSTYITTTTTGAPPPPGHPPSGPFF